MNRLRPNLKALDRAPAMLADAGLREIETFVGGAWITRTTGEEQDGEAFAGGGLRFDSGDSVSAFATRGFTQLDEAFDLADRVPVPVGRYDLRRLTVFEPPNYDQERLGLWDRDVVEAFIGSDPQRIRRYAEFEVSPSNERLDLTLDLPEKNFAWNSRFQSAVHIDRKADVWTCEMRIPLQALADAKPKPGARWRLNLFRCDYADKAFLAWNPTLRGTFHLPERFGTLEFAD